MFILKSTELRLQFSLAWSLAGHLAARGQNLTSYARSLPVGESVNEQRRGEAASELKRQHFHFFSSSPPAATHAQNRRPFQRQPPCRGRAPSSFRRPFCRRASQSARAVSRPSRGRLSSDYYFPLFPLLLLGDSFYSTLGTAPFLVDKKNFELRSELSSPSTIY